MELSTEILDTIDISNDKDVLEVVKQLVAEEDTVFNIKAEGAEYTESADYTEEAEIEEIIEIIEEVEEEGEESSEDYISHNENSAEALQNEQYQKNAEAEIFGFDDGHSVFKTARETEPTLKRSRNDVQKSNKKQLITYDVDEDWQDEEMEHMEELEEGMDPDSEMMNHREESLEMPVALSGDKKGDKSKMGQDFGNNSSNIENIDNNVGHEIIKNENNLLYTVLGTKKATSAKGQQSDKISDAHYIKMEQLDENTIPVEGMIYYEGDNMETLYVAQSVDENEQYQYDTSNVEQGEQAWEANNPENNQNQEEENSQDQIFLHEDEDGQLYFKDESGALQPVYLTEDGNYAIAESSDDQDKDSQPKTQIARMSEEDPLATPDLDVKSTHSKLSTTAPTSSSHDLDNEDNTVTISLIISEDEHGQKRTQVIIPTTDSMKCDICNKSFKTSFQLLRHNRLKHAREEDITTRNFPCDLCPKRYPDQNSLARHRKTHTGDRPFQCLECHKNFPTSTALRRHLTLHNSQSRPLPCIYCGRRFVEKSSLAKHEQSHLPGDQRTHTCDVCHKSFLHATDLSLHKKYHDPDKKFDCEVCGREFNRLNNLQRHMMVHQQQGANEEILSCDVCGITYKFMSSLTRHMVTTHMNPEKLRQQAEEQRRKRENNYRRYLENRKMYETQHSGGYGTKRTYHHNARILSGNSDDTA